ncbi:hypothetical protein [Streptomyces sp. CC224B]|uniref:hypothetical protein n=1 Tax=Streptomyces sp. CC224B TaxID=3044571 RepID=UPI0024A8DAB3|nr:hypothetical protein [Streptomyces sp. CC224B]
MPAHPAAYGRLAAQLRLTPDPDLRDQLLDTWLDYRDLATEWDARQWGLQPDDWAARIIAAACSEGVASS